MDLPIFSSAGDGVVSAGFPICFQNGCRESRFSNLPRPVLITDGVLIGVADGDDLELGMRQKRQQFPDTLCAARRYRPV